MDIVSWVVCLYSGGTLIVGWYLFQEFRVRKDKQEMNFGPGYWGLYPEVTEEQDSLSSPI